MKLRIFVEPQQGATYTQILRVAQVAEGLGFDGFFRSDHFLKMGNSDGLPGPTDAWLTLGALARETEHIRLGTLLTAGTFRLPGHLAIMVAQVDEMSGGRVELGIGAGWYEDEHTAYGIPFPSLKERFDRLEEQLSVITGLWATPAGEKFSFHGKYYQLSDSPALPHPVQRPKPPVILGGLGAGRTPALAARYADEFNVPFPPLEVFSSQRRAVDRACEQIGRDPGSIGHSVALVVCCGSNEKEFDERAKAIGRDPAELRVNGACGLPGEAVEALSRFANAGASCAYLQVLDLDDLDHLELVAREVAPYVA
ncbi:MAG: LLM class F420-dependent oxidoreductase [Acidimicrobiales bacterium]